VGFARERLGACLNIAPYKQGGRARLSQALLARNKRRSERSSRLRRAGGARSNRRCHTLWQTPVSPKAIPVGLACDGLQSSPDVTG
ncbi:hypothetical protein RLF34_02685, partial [Streptococcus pneumoniae]|nr:hypothetical protein [Streptococcus pneumoniae]